MKEAAVILALFAATYAFISLGIEIRPNRRP